MLGEYDQGASSLTYWYDSSVSTYGYTGHFNHGIANWEVLSSQVDFTESSSSSADLKIFFGYGNLPAGVLGVTDMWDYNWYGGVSEVSGEDVYNGTNFDQARIRMDEYEFQAQGYSTWGNKVKVTAHEVGHALSLFHFERPTAHTDKTSWMYTYKTDSPYPSVDDDNHLIYKWGS